MKVYVLTEDFGENGDEILGVYRTMEAAHKASYARNMPMKHLKPGAPNEPPEWFWGAVSIYEYELQEDG